MDKQRLIASFQKNAVEVIKVNLNNWRGQLYIDVRAFFLDEEKAEHPTRKGFCLHIELLPELIAALRKAEAALDGEEPGEVKSMEDGR